MLGAECLCSYRRRIVPLINDWSNKQEEARDFWRLVCGDHLGTGCYRKTFACNLDPTLVVKVEQEEGCFHNVREWDIWQTIMHAPKWRKWVAPCVAISPKGNFLLMRRTQPVTMRDMPARVPSFLTDLKPGNFGLLNGKVVCHDYATPIVELELRLKKAKWNVG